MDNLCEVPYPTSFPVASAQGPSLPPGEGKWAIPQHATFASIVNSIARTYRYTHDEALKASRSNALAVRRDPVVMDALRSRQIPTAQLPWHIEAENDQDTAQAEAQAEMTAIIEAIPRFQDLKMHLLEALWYGRYGVQLRWGWSFTSGKKRLMVKAHHPVNGDKLRFKFSGRVGILVHSTEQADTEPTDLGRCHFLTPDERKQFIVHRHEPEDVDFFEPDLAGGIHGVGIRSRIYWFWWLRSQVTTWLMDYLERVGAGGFTIYYYE
ncbi:MAG TPA: hypothetical protein VEI97_17985, partial [bacterium]|nr:hypothetical protein [bacterium]